MIGALIGFFCLLYVLTLFFHKYSTLIIVLGIAGIAGYVLYRVLKNKRIEQEHQRQFEEAIKLPPVRRDPISGAYRCRVCGSFSYIDRELVPTTHCKFCGAPIKDLVDRIDERDRKYERDLEERKAKENERRQEMLMQRQKDELEFASQRIKDRNKSIVTFGIGTVIVIVAGIITVIGLNYLPDILEYMATDKLSFLSAIQKAFSK